jgi:hypothetical protein
MRKHAQAKILEFFSVANVNDFYTPEKRET